MNAAMVELFLRSMRAPAAVIEMVRLFSGQGFGAMRYKPMDAADPAWKIYARDPQRTVRGIWVQADGPNSRLTVAAFLEGDDDEIFAKLDAMGSALGAERMPAAGAGAGQPVVSGDD